MANPYRRKDNGRFAKKEFAKKYPDKVKKVKINRPWFTHVSFTKETDK